MSPPRVHRLNWRRYLLALLLGLLGSSLILAPAHAQDDGGDSGGAAEEPPVEEPPLDEGVDGSGEITFDLGGLPPIAPGVELEAEPEPIERVIVDDADQSIQVVATDSSDPPWVDVVVAVPPALAGELQSGSFSLTENGDVRSVDVVKLRDTLEVVVVIDTSGSMLGDPIAAATVAAKDFVDSLDPEIRVGVVGFGATASIKAPLGSGRGEIASAIDGLTANGETALYDALVLGASQFADENARRFVVVLSDGTDTASSAGLDTAAAAMLDAAVNMYAITLQSADADFTGLERLADQINGQVVAATDTTSLAETYASIASRLTNQYRMTYRSAASGTATLGIAVDANGFIAIATETVDLANASSTPSGPVETTPGGGPSSVVIDTSNPDTILTDALNGPLDSENALYIGGGVVFAGVALVLFLVLSATPAGPSAFERLNFKPGAKRSGIGNIADRASGIADRILESQEKRGALDAVLEKAGMDMRPGEYIMAAAGAAVGLSLFGFIMFGPIGGGIAFLAGIVGGRMYVNVKAKRRQKMFGNQLGDTLMMIAGSLRAGHGIVEAIDTVANQADAPTGEEFTRAVGESRIGRDMVESMYDIATRTESEDFIWVVRAIGINRELGGDLAEILDNVGETIRDRNRLRDQVQALSAEGKVSAAILVALPICVGLWVKTSNPEYLASMTDETAGKIMLGAAVVMLLSGALWLKKLVNVEF